MTALPEGMTGFVSGGYIANGSSTGSNRLGAAGGQQLAYGSMGLEIEAAPDLTVGTAFGYAYGFSAPGEVGRTESRTTQVAAYGSYRLGGGAYVAGLASAEIGRMSTQRQAATGNMAYNLLRRDRNEPLRGDGGDRHQPRHRPRPDADAARGARLFVLPARRVRGAGRRDRRCRWTICVCSGSRPGSAPGLPARCGWAPGRFSRSSRPITSTPSSGANDGMSVRFADVPDFAFALPYANGDTSWGEVRGGLTLTNGRFSFGGGVETSIGRQGVRDDRAVADFTFRF